MKKTREDIIEIMAQMYQLKNMPITGGWRLTLDLFDSREKDVMMIMSLVNTQATIKIKILPMDDNDAA